MPTLTVPNGSISYTLSGHGPPLLLIPGANGTPSIFAPLTRHLTSHFTVASFARRWYSASAYTTSKPDLSTQSRLHTDADDAAALISHLSPHGPAYVFGTSSGAIVALTLLSRNPEVVRFLVAHEPPLTKLLGTKGDEVYRKYEQIVSTYRSRGIRPAVELFVDALVGDAGRDSAEGRIATTMGRRENEANVRFFFENELLGYTAVEVDERVLAKRAGEGKWMALYGVETREAFFRRVVERLAEGVKEGGGRLRVEGVPGGHLGFVSRPEEFAGALRGWFIDERGGKL